MEIKVGFRVKVRMLEEKPQEKEGIRLPFEERAAGANILLFVPIGRYWSLDSSCSLR